jgi:hypothetical protein
MLFYLSVALAMLSSMLYHVTLKFTPSDVNPALSLAVAYTLAAVLCIALLPFFPLGNPVVKELKELNWASYALAFPIVGLEIGFLLAYRAGWNVSTAGIVVTVVATLLLVPIGLVVFNEKLSFVNMVGVLVCALGLIMVNIGK